jgi:hypothetical protein
VEVGGSNEVPCFSYFILYTAYNKRTCKKMFKVIVIEIL